MQLKPEVSLLQHNALFECNRGIKDENLYNMLSTLSHLIFLTLASQTAAGTMLDRELIYLPTYKFPFADHASCVCVS